MPRSFSASDNKQIAEWTVQPTDDATVYEVHSNGVPAGLHLVNTHDDIWQFQGLPNLAVLRFDSPNFALGFLAGVLGMISIQETPAK